VQMQQLSAQADINAAQTHAGVQMQQVSASVEVSSAHCRPSH
jgi:hypothetical protein